MWVLSLPEDFRPEEYGWEVANPIVPSQQREAAMQELHRFGFVSTQYARFQVPFALPFTMSLNGYDPTGRQYRVFYMRPFEWQGQKATAQSLRDEIRFGFGRAGGFTGHPFVS